MILRRFIQHVKEQNWVAVGLDIIVVIAGIFIGMQVTDLNEDYKNQQEGLYHLHALQQFLQQDIINKEQDITVSEQHQQNTFQAMLVLTKETPSDDDVMTFQQHHGGAFYLWGPKSKPAQLRRIIEDGKLDYIQSRDMQEAILNFDSAYTEAIYQTDTSYQYSKDLTLVIMNSVEYSQQGISSPLEALRTNKPLIAALRGKSIMQRIQLETLRTIQQQNTVLLEKLNDYIGIAGESVS